jgi:hypothetical protein
MLGLLRNPGFAFFAFDFEAKVRKGGELERKAKGGPFCEGQFPVRKTNSLEGRTGERERR